MPPLHTPPSSSPSHGPEDENILRAQQSRTREHLENALRIKKIEMTEGHRKLGEIGRTVTHLEGEVHHLEEDIRRTEGELRALEADTSKEGERSKFVQMGMRDKERELRQREDEISKLEREIERLREEILAKEKKIHEIKEETRGFVRDKDELRRESELGHFTASAEASRAHDKKLQLGRYKQELMRKELDINHRKHEETQLKHELLLKEQDISGLEAELRNVRNN